MSNKEKLEKDYKKSNALIECEAEQQLKKIQQEGNALRGEVNKISGIADLSVSEKEQKTDKKKVKS